MLGINCIASLLKQAGVHLDDAVEEITARFRTESMKRGGEQDKSSSRASIYGRCKYFFRKNMVFL